MLTISVWTTASLHEKSNLFGLIQDLGITFDQEFDLISLLGLNCMVNLSNRTKDDGSTKVVVSSVAPLMEEMEAIELPTAKFELDAYNEAEFNALSDGLKNIIKESPEYKALFPL